MVAFSLLLAQTISLLFMNNKITKTSETAYPIDVETIHKKAGDYFVNLVKFDEISAKMAKGLHINENDAVCVFQVCSYYINSNDKDCNKAKTILTNKNYLYILKKNPYFLPRLRTIAREKNEDSLATVIQDTINETKNSSTKNSK